MMIRLLIADDERLEREALVEMVPRDDFAVLFKSGIRNILNFHGFFILAFCFESNHIIPRCRGNCKTLKTQKSEAF